MFDIPQHDKLAYEFGSGAELLDIPPKDFGELIQKHRLRTFCVKKKRYVPNFEIDRLVSVLLQEQVQRELDQAKTIKKSHVHSAGTG